LLNPLEGTILSVAGAAAEEAYHLAPHEREFYRLGGAIVRAAHDALERTPEQLPVLREAGVVDSGGAGLVYFLEGILRFLPAATQRATVYPRRAIRPAARKPHHEIGDDKFCTEFMLADARIESTSLRELLRRHGESLLVAGEAPTLRVHLHTGDPQAVQRIASEHGRVERLKIDDMAHQHRILLLDPPKRIFSFVAVVPGLGFDRIARELGADETLLIDAGVNPSVAELALAIRKCTAETVVLLPNDPNVVLAARQAAAVVTNKEVIVAPATDVAAGLAILVDAGGRIEDGPVPNVDELAAAASKVHSATIFFAAKATTIAGLRLGKGAPAGRIGKTLFTAEDLESVTLEAAQRLSQGDGGLLTLYYGGAQKERDAEHLAGSVRERLSGVEVEWFFGGQRTIEYVVSFER
jgi:DAK2 domain fusion protein YloV